MPKILRISLFLVISLTITFPISSLTLKVASLAPKDTPWDTALRKLGTVWKEISGGKVDIQIYPGGVAGNEENMLRLMRLGQLDGAALTGTGLNRINTELLVMSLPMFFRETDEINYVIDNMSEHFERLVSEKGFKMIGWTTAGWVHFFGKEEILFPNDLRAQKLAVSAEDEDILYTWRAMGFDAIPLHLTEILGALQSGMTEAFHTSPIVSALYQWFGLATHMSDVKMAPLIAGLVITDRSWKRIPAAFREDFLAAVGEVLEPLHGEVIELEDEVKQIMIENGLTIDQPTPESLDAWDEVVNEGYEYLIDTSISRETFDAAKGYRDEFRAQHEGR